MSQTHTESKCFECGYSAPPGDEAWDTVDDPTLGTITRCPNCASTNVVAGR